MEDPAFGDFRQPDIYKPAEQFRVFARCDVNTVARCESRTNNFRIGADVLYMIVERLERDKHLREHFGLPVE